MTAREILDEIEQLRNDLQKKTEEYFYETDYTSIVDSVLNAKSISLLTFIQEYNLTDCYANIKEQFCPISHNAIEYVEYIASIRAEILECEKWNNPKSRLRLINEIAYSFQSDYNISEINIILNSVGISNTDNSIPSSKRVYLQNVLQTQPINKIIKLAKSSNLFESFIQVEEVDIISDEYLQEQIDKCITKINNDDYDGAITNARTMIEELLLTIEERITGIRPKNEGDLLKIYKSVRKLLKLESTDDKIDNSLNQIIIGFNNIISDRHACEYRPCKRHALLVVNSCLTISKFLISSYQYQYLDNK
jgi:hypothetical protein